MDPRPRFGVLVPVKPPTVAKTRLSGLGEPVRRALALAFAMDTVDAALACPLVGRVLAVTDDHETAAEIASLGAEVIPDGVADDLNATLVQAAAELARTRPELSVAALCADLPALRPEQLGSALAATPPDAMCFVADREQVGTTLLTATHVEGFRPRFGPASRADHLEVGARELQLDAVPGLRRDVDAPADLQEALVLGVGPRTTRVVDRFGLRGSR